MHKDEADYILDVLNEFREKYNKIKLDGIAYEVYLRQVEPDEFWEDIPGEYDGRKTAVQNLKDAGVITKYTIEERYESEYYRVLKAICYIDERKIFQNTDTTTAEINTINKDVIKLKGNETDFRLNLINGNFTLNELSGTFTPKGQEFKFMKALLESSDHQAEYSSLINTIWSGRENSKANRNDLALLLKKIKTKLKILPASKSENKDIFQNIKGFGYKITAI
jgi:hypothetical protein